MTDTKLKTLFIRLLIGGVFFVSLFCGAISAGGVWSYLKLKDVDASFTAITESCNEQSTVGDYEKDDSTCFWDTLIPLVGFAAVSYFSAVIFGVVALLFLAIGIISLRRHRLRIRLEKQEAT